MSVRSVVLVAVALLVGCAAPGTIPVEDAVDGPVLVVEPPVQVAASDFREREGDVALHPSDPVRQAVAYNERWRAALTGQTATEPITPDLLRNAVALTEDAGARWTRVVLPAVDDAPAGSKWAVACSHFDPSVAITPDGVVHVTTLVMGCGVFYGSTSGVLHATVDASGASEPDVVALGAAGLAGVFHDRQWLAADPATGVLGVAWTEYTAAASRTRLLASTSEDGGRTWSAPVALDEAVAPSTQNWLVHAAWGPDGLFHVTGYGCVEGGTPFTDGGCLVHFRGAERAEIPRSDCPGGPPAARFGYAVSAVDRERDRWFVASPLFVDGGAVGVCVFASDDGGATWPRGAFLADADHPSLAAAPGGVAVAYLARADGAWTPTVAVLDGGTLATSAAFAVGPSYDADTDDDGRPEYGDYDAMEAEADRFLWMLTQPNQEGRKSGDPWNDLDVWGYRGTFR